MLSNTVTLVVVTRDRLIRADFAGPRAAEPKLLVVRDRPHIDDVATLVEMALTSDKRKPGRTFVLLADIWTHTLSLAALSTHGMNPAELLQSLAFEAEPLSGLSAFDSVTAAAPIGETAGQRHFWVTQLATHVRDQIQDCIKAAGGKLAGILHPGGVPHSLEAQPAAAATGRVEFWPAAVVRNVARDGATTRMRIDDSGTAAGWFDAVEAWKRESGAGQVAALVSEGELPLDATQDEYLALTDDGVLRRWLAAWNQTLAAKQPAVPLVVPAVKPLTKQQRMAISAVLAVVAAGACYAHDKWIDKELAQIAAEKTELEAPGKEIAAVQTQIAAVEKDKKTTAEDRDRLRGEVTQAEEVLGAHRRRLADLMRRLADDSSRDWVLQKIDGNGREITLTGVTMHPEHISELAEGMSIDLGKLGWTVEPPKQTARNMRDDGGPWTFELRLHDTSPLPPSTVPAPSGTPPQSTVVGAGPR